MLQKGLDAEKVDRRESGELAEPPWSVGKISEREFGQHIRMKDAAAASDQIPKLGDRAAQVINPYGGVDEDQVHGRSRGAAAKSGIVPPIPTSSAAACWAMKSRNAASTTIVRSSMPLTAMA